MKWTKYIFASPAMTAFALTWASGAVAMSKAEIDAGVAATLQAFYAQDPGNRQLVGRAAGVLVFPRVTKAGVGIGAEHGEGALCVDGKIKQYYTVNGAALGALFGVGERAELVLFMTTEARDEFVHSKGWTIGADAGAAVASKGIGVEFASLTLGRPILSFVMNERGLIGDLSLAGAKIAPVAD